MRVALSVFMTVAFVSSTATAQQVHFFLASPSATNDATDCLSAANAGVNPIVATALPFVEVTLCMQLHESRLADGVGTYGGGLDLDSMGSLAGGPGLLTVFNPAGRWGFVQNGTPGSPPDPYSGMLAVTADLISEDTPGDWQNPVGPIFRIATGNLTIFSAGYVKINIPEGGAIGANDPAGALGGAFGWSDTGVPDISGIGSNLAGTVPGPQANYSELGAGDPSYGFILSDLNINGGGVTTSVPDLYIIPEPSTFILLALFGVVGRRQHSMTA